MVGKLLKLKENELTVLIMSGMSAVFAGLFGTPLTATLFCMEFESVGTIITPALLPCYLAAYVASRVSGMLGVHAEVFPLETAMAVNLGSVWRIAILAVLVSCWALQCAMYSTKRSIWRSTTCRIPLCELLWAAQ